MCMRVESSTQVLTAWANRHLGVFSTMSFPEPNLSTLMVATRTV